MIQTVPFAPEHAARAAALERICFSAPWSEAELLASSALPNAIYISAFCDKEYSGYAGMYTVEDEGEINNIAVFPAFRRRGVGDALVRALFEAGRAAGLRRLTLEVRASNGAALALYEKNGFYRVGLRRGYYTAPKEDAVLLDKDL